MSEKTTIMFERVCEFWPSVWSVNFNTCAVLTLNTLDFSVSFVNTIILEVDSFWRSTAESVLLRCFVALGSDGVLTSVCFYWKYLLVCVDDHRWTETITLSIGFTSTSQLLD